MAAIAMLVGLLLAQSAPSTMTVEATRNRTNVGYDELMRGDAQGAIDEIEANSKRGVSDPAALINLGSAHARLGHFDLARQYYSLAIKSNDSYDLELADGRWMDSRRAARLALRMLDDGNVVLALR